MKLMLRISLLISLCLTPFIRVQAQAIAVTATITDSDSQTWNNGTFTVTLNGNYSYNGVPVSSASQTGSLNSSGALAVTLYNTSTLAPSGAIYNWYICSNTSAACSAFQSPVITSNLSALLSSFVIAPRFVAGYGTTGYLDVEAQAGKVSATYYNVTTPAWRQCTVVTNGACSTWATVGGGGGGSGTVTPEAQYIIPCYTATGTGSILGNCGTLSSDAAGNLHPAANQGIYWGAGGFVSADGGGNISIGSGSGGCTINTGVNCTVSLNALLYKTNTICAGVGTAANPSVAACTAAPAGVFSCAIAASATTCNVNTTAVTANSSIQVGISTAEGTQLGVTCNTTPSGIPIVLLKSKTAGTGFTINMPTITTNPACFEYSIIN